MQCSVSACLWAENYNISMFKGAKRERTSWICHLKDDY